MLRMPLAIWVLMLLGCRERITAPEVMGLIAQWDSARIKLSEQGLASTFAPVHGWENLPDPGEIPITLDHGRALYRAIVVELRFVHSRYEANGCDPPNTVTLILWREARLDPGLDVIIAHIGSGPGVMEGPLEQAPWSIQCGLPSSAGAGAFFNRHMGGNPNYARPAMTGRFRADRVGTLRPCDFIERPTELAMFGASCAMQRFDVDLDARLPPDTDGRGIAGGASQIHVTNRAIPGAVFTWDCATTATARSICG